MQATEKFYNVLWWSKKARQDELDYESSASLGVQRDTTSRQQQRFCSVLRVPSFRIDNSFYADWAKSVAVAMWWCRDVVISRCGDRGGVSAAFIIKFIILPVLARLLTPPQHIVKFFCRLHRLSYYVVMLRYFFRILFSSLCCAVINFVAGIVHGVLLDIFYFWACNPP